jgi:phosphoribosylamine--glycine ligase
VAGDNGTPVVVTGRGDAMQAAREHACDRGDDIVLSNLYYRDDIGEHRIDGDGNRPQAWGYLGSA